MFECGGWRVGGDKERLRAPTFGCLLKILRGLFYLMHFNKIFCHAFKIFSPLH